MVSELPGMLRYFPRRAPASPPNAKPISPRVSCNLRVNFTRGKVNEGKRSAKILRTHVLSSQKKRRTRMISSTQRPLVGRSRNVRVYRLCTRLEIVLQQGHGAVGEAARTVTVTLLVMLTWSMTRSERSGRIVIGSQWYQETVLLEEFVQSSSLSHLASASLRKSQNMGQNSFFGPSCGTLLCKNSEPGKGACILTRNTPAAFSALPTAPCHDRKSPARYAPVRPDQAVSSYWRGSLRRPGCYRRP